MPSKQQSKEERRAELEAELEALDSEPEVGRSRADNMNITIDLSNPDSVRRALKLGLLERGDLDEFDEPAAENGDGGEPEAEEPPRRRQRYD